MSQKYSVIIVILSVLPAALYANDTLIIQDEEVMETVCSKSKVSLENFD